MIEQTATTGPRRGQDASPSDAHRRVNAIKRRGYAAQADGPRGDQVRLGAMGNPVAPKLLRGPDSSRRCGQNPAGPWTKPGSLSCGGRWIAVGSIDYRHVGWLSYSRAVERARNRRRRSRLGKDNEMRTNWPPLGQGAARARSFTARTARANALKKRGYAALCCAPPQSLRTHLETVGTRSLSARSRPRLPQSLRAPRMTVGDGPTLSLDQGDHPAVTEDAFGGCGGQAEPLVAQRGTRRIASVMVERGRRFKRGQRWPTSVTTQTRKRTSPPSRGTLFVKPRAAKSWRRSQQSSSASPCRKASGEPWSSI